MSSHKCPNCGAQINCNPFCKFCGVELIAGKNISAGSLKWRRNICRACYPAHRGNRLKLKERIIAHYSNRTMACANPFNEHDTPYTNILALVIDHIKGNGAQERRTLGPNGARDFYQSLANRGFPAGYQVLCYNCNRIKYLKNGEHGGYNAFA